MIFALTQNCIDMPIVRHARAMVAARPLGDIRVVQVEYAQDWQANELETICHNQAGWRTDPAQTSARRSTGDIVTLAFNLAGFVTGLERDRPVADPQSFVPRRKADDSGHIMLRFKGGAEGMVSCSQVAAGCETALRLRVFATKAGIGWVQEDPNYLWVTPSAPPAIGSMGRGPDQARKWAAPAKCPQDTPENIRTPFPTSMPRPLGLHRQSDRRAGGPRFDLSGAFAKG